MPFVSSKSFYLFPLNYLSTIEKNGKTLNLLKASAKKINPSKKRKIIPLMGTIKQYHLAVQQDKSSLAVSQA